MHNSFAQGQISKLSALRVSHASVLQDFQAKAVDVLCSWLMNSKRSTRKSAANAGKLSELEIEILELNESQEQAEEEHTKVLDSLA
jgi:hypothetical protein